MPAPLLTLRPLGETRLAWVLEHAGRLQSGEAELGALPPLPEGTRVRLLLPGDRVIHAEVRIAAKNPRLIAQALPYALEEQLAEDLDQLILAHGPRTADDRVPARAVNRAWLEGWLERLRAHGLAPQAAYPELDLLPTPEHGWLVLDWAGLRLARSAEGEAVALEPGLFAALVGDAPLTPLPVAGEPLRWLHQQMDESRAIDLLGHPQADPLGARLRPWRVPAGLLALALLLTLALMGYETHRLKHEQAAMQAEIERVAREAAPEVKRWVNPLAQLRQQAAGGATTPSGTGMLDLLAKLAPALAGRPDIKLGALRYQSGVLEAQLGSAEHTSLEALLAALRQQSGLTAELSEQRVENGQTTARLRLKGARS